MKKLVFALVASAVFSGVAFAAEPQPGAFPCTCGNSQTQDGSKFKPLFPQYEIQAPLEG